MKFEIPTLLDLAGKTITIKYDSKLIHDDDARGQSKYRDNVIMLQADTDAEPVQKQDIELTFWHELTHWILEQMDEQELKNNEKFIFLFSGLLHQAIKTMR